jgi:hypothetical protein
VLLWQVENVKIATIGKAEQQIQKLTVMKQEDTKDIMMNATVIDLRKNNKKAQHLLSLFILFISI